MIGSGVHATLRLRGSGVATLRHHTAASNYRVGVSLVLVLCVPLL